MRIKNARPFPCTTTIGTQPQGKSFLTVIIKGTFDLQSSGEAARASREQIPVFVADQPYDTAAMNGLLKFEHDLAPFKPRADIVLVGNAYPSTGRSTSACDVQIEVGNTRKVLRVVGDRQWSYPDGTSVPVAVGPTLFDAMPLTYDRAFGGRDEQAQVTSPVNPLGRGLIATPSVQSIHGTCLPNIEDPEHMVRSWDSRPRPVGCGFFPRSNAPRRSYLGTYDEAWRKARAPAPPDDFGFEFFNAAHPDLQVHEYLVGNEPVTLTNVVPASHRLQFFLPCLRPVVTVHSARAKGSAAPGGARSSIARAVPVQLDTLVFVPDERHFYLVWRGVIPLSRPEAIEQVEEIKIEYQLVPRATPASPRATDRR